jgi:uncharacterized protein
MREHPERTLYRTIPYTIQIADTFSTRLKGLMFRKNPLNKQGLWIVPCNSIHMCFMHFPIDAVFLDHQNKILKLVKSLKPWQIVPSVKQAHSVLELPSGSIDVLQLKEQQIIVIDGKKEAVQ